MSDKTIKVSPEIHKLVDEHTQKVGGKIGKFFEIAAMEKLSNGWLDNVKLESVANSIWPLKTETK